MKHNWKLVQLTRVIKALTNSAKKNLFFFIFCWKGLWKLFSSIFKTNGEVS